MAVRAGADALGLVGAMPSGPGVIGDALAAQIAASIPPPVASFLLSSETQADALAEHVRRVNPTALQIVSHIEPAAHERLDTLIGGTGIKRVQVIHVEDEQALDLIERYEPFVDAFLLDSGRPSASIPELGGTGRAHDWRISASFVERTKRPVFLAGGLGPSNAVEAIETVRPFGIDLCSSVRTEDRLDETELSALMAAVRSCA